MNGAGKADKIRFFRHKNAGGLPKLVHNKTELHSLLFDSVPIPTIAYSTDGEVLACNRAMSVVLGMPASGVVGTEVATLKEITGLDDSLVAALSDDSRQSREIKLRDENGDQRVYRACHSPFTYDQSKASGSIVTLNDITDQHRASAAFEDQSRLLETMIEAIPAPVFYKEGRSDLLGCNSAFAQLSGSRREDIVGQKIDREKMRVLYESQPIDDYELLRTGGSTVCNVGFGTPEGDVRHVVFHKAVFVSAVNQKGNIVGVGMDVTHQRQVEDELRAKADHLAETNALLDELIEGMGQGLVVFGGGRFSERKSILTNAKFADIVELPEEISRLGVRHDVMLAFFERRGDFSFEELAKLNAFRRNPESPGLMNLVYKLPSGRWVQSVGSARANGNGRIVTFSDITDIVESENERARLAEELSHMQRLQSLGQLTGGVAHDFNNLLAVILGNAELLERTFGPTDARLKNIVSASERGAELTQRLLSFSRKQALNPEAIDLKAHMQAMLSMLQSTLGETIEISLVSAPDQWLCFADVGQLENAILNLVMNSRDAMPDGGNLYIETSNTALDEAYAAQHIEVIPGDYVVVEIRDDGTGMQEDEVVRAIEPFYSTKEVGHGSGLGLSMVFGFMKQSAGHLSIESRLGQGTSVKMYFPRSTGNVDHKPERKPAHSAKSMRSILVVEDNPEVRDVIVRTLSSLGYSVSACRDGKEVLEGLTDHEFIDLLVTDVVLPEGISGGQLGDKLRAERPDLPILYMSGYAEDAIRSGSKNMQYAPLLKKPFSINELATAVQRILR
ncbi:MAG: response regulator [Pseudomonadota bacterium]